MFRRISTMADNKNCTSRIASYVKDGKHQFALDLYYEMQKKNSSQVFTVQTYVALLKSCSKLKQLTSGLGVHSEVLMLGFLDNNHYIGSTLIDMYAKCGSLSMAEKIFDSLNSRDVVSWTALITGLNEHGYAEEGLQLFYQMHLEGILPNHFTFVCSFKACTRTGTMANGQALHVQANAQGFVEDNVFVGSALVDMYAKCGFLAKAQNVFDDLPVRNEVSWNALIAGYSESDQHKETLKYFEQMQQEGISPSAVTFICLLKACGNSRSTEKVAGIHAVIDSEGLLQGDLVIGSTLVDIYAKMGVLVQAQKVFEKLPIRNVVSWTTLITRYVEHRHSDEALNCLEKMQVEGISPNTVTLLCSLKACASIGAEAKGREIHAEIQRQGLLDRELALGNTVIDMYAKCGLPQVAQEVFDVLPAQNVISWTALMSGYAQIGSANIVLSMFHNLLDKEIKPNMITFTVLLRACSRIGSVKDSEMYFQAMSRDYGIAPNFGHHTWLADVCGRAGQFDKALTNINKFKSNHVVWQTLLASCSNWGNVELGKNVFEHTMHMY